MNRVSYQPVVEIGMPALTCAPIRFMHGYGSVFSPVQTDFKPGFNRCNALRELKTNGVHIGSGLFSIAQVMSE